MSPGAALRLPFFAMPLRVCLGRVDIYASAGAVDAVHPDLDRVAQAQPPARALGLQRGAELVQRPVAAHPAHRQEALEPLVSELDERALLDKSDHLAGEG